MAITDLFNPLAPLNLAKQNMASVPTAQTTTAPAPAPVNQSKGTYIPPAPVVSTSKLATDNVTKQMNTVNQASNTLQQAQANPVAPAPVTPPPGTVQVFNAYGTSNLVPKSDLAYWQSQGWNTTQATATPSVNAQGQTAAQMTAQANAPVPTSPAPTAGAATGTTSGTGTTGTTDQNLADQQAKQGALSAEQQQGYQDFHDALDQMRNGSFPLTPDQQAQIDSIRQSYQNLISQQVSANANYTGAITQAGIASGRNRYAPELEIGNIHQAVTKGLQEISTINGQMVSAISQAKQAFEDRNYKLLDAAYTALNKNIEDRQKVLDSMWKETQDSIQNAQRNQELAETAKRDAQAAAHEQAMEKISSDQLTLSQKKEAFDEVMSDKNYTLEQKKQAEKEWKDQQDVAIEKGRLNLERQKAAADAAGVPVGSIANFGDKSNLPGVQKLDNGGLYFDPAQFGSDAAGKKKAAAAQAIASQYGIKTLNAKDADAAKQTDSSISKLQQMKNVWDATAQSGLWNNHFWSTLGNEIAQTPVGQQIWGYGTMKASLQGLIVSLENTGGIPRVQAETYNNLIKTLPDPGAFNLRTKATGDAAFDNLIQELSTNLNSKLGSKNYESLTQFVSQNPKLPTLTKLLPGFTPDIHSQLTPTMQAVDFVKAKMPGVSDDDVLQFLTQ